MKARLRARLRAAVAIFVLCTLAVLVSAHRATAQLEEVLMGWGDHMMRLEDATRQDRPRPIRMNGERMFMASGMIDQPVGTVLDRFEARCQEVDGAIDELSREVAPASSEADADGPAVLRSEHDGRGFVACIDAGAGSLPLERWLERVERFLTSHDVGDIGDIRYAYAAPGQHGTHVVVAWTEDHFDLDAFDPASEEDAPGRDIAGVPRPPRARRVLSAFEENARQEVAMYEHEKGASLASVRAFYRDALGRDGWRGAQQDVHDRALVVTRAGEMVSVVFRPRPEGMMTTLLRSR